MRTWTATTRPLPSDSSRQDDERRDADAGRRAAAGRADEEEVPRRPGPPPGAQPAGRRLLHRPLPRLLGAGLPDRPARHRPCRRRAVHRRLRTRGLDRADHSPAPPRRHRRRDRRRRPGQLRLHRPGHRPLPRPARLRHRATATEIHGWIGRRNPDRDQDGDHADPKYLNTAETELFTKGHELYGLTEGAAELAAGAVPVIVEGPLDALAVTLAGDGDYVGIAPTGHRLHRRAGRRATPIPRRPKARDHCRHGRRPGRTAGRSANLLAAHRPWRRSPPPRHPDRQGPRRAAADGRRHRSASGPGGLPQPCQCTYRRPRCRLRRPAGHRRRPGARRSARRGGHRRRPVDELAGAPHSSGGQHRHRPRHRAVRSVRRRPCSDRACLGVGTHSIARRTTRTVH